MNGAGFILPKSYRKIGFGFFVIALIALVSTSYLIWANVTVVITPNAESTGQELVFEIKDSSSVIDFADESVVPGKISVVTVEDTKTFDASGSKTLTSNVVGEVTIVNDYSKEQTLVETTRLASPDDPATVLVRLNRTVTVQPGQRVTVQVYPEDADGFKSLKPQRLIIPGLWGPLQEYIYAENSADLKSGGIEVAVVDESDLEVAEEQLRDELYQKALSSVDDQLEPQQELWPKLVTSQAGDAAFDAAAGDEASQFNGSMTLDAVVVAFDESELVAAARKRLSGGEGQPLISLDPTSFKYELQRHDAGAQEATIKASFSASAISDASQELFDKRAILGMTEDEVKEYYSQFPEVKSVEVNFKPAWLKKIPRLSDKVRIEIAE